ncbi:MAG TPA: DMT family transporter, partial [Candidatus Cloacimonadota bacterium]|nr:DMT family transporter [Candidatus Cloacimonadota bacterium]
MSQGFLYALIALFLWGIHGPAGRYLSLQGVDMYFVFALRFWLGSLVLFLYLMIKKSLRFAWFENKKQILLIAIVGIFGNSLLYHLTLNYLPGTLVMVLENLSPIFVLFASFYYLRVKPSLKEIAALLVSFIGIGLIIL